MKFLTQPNAHTREFLSFCNQGDMDCVVKFFQKPTLIDHLKNYFLKKPNYYSYQIEHDYCCWFGLEVAARNNNLELMEFIIKSGHFQYYLSPEWTKAINFTYNLFEPLPIIKLVTDNLVRDKNYFIHIAKNMDYKGPIFQYKEIKPMFIDDPLLATIENFNLELFNYLLDKTHIRGSIVLEDYLIKFLRTLDCNNKETFNSIPNINKVIEDKLEYSILEVVFAKNDYAKDFLLANYKITDDIFSNLQKYKYSESEKEYLNHFLQEFKYLELEKNLILKEKKTDKKRIKI